jgi:Gametolysin peptidase M11
MRSTTTCYRGGLTLFLVAQLGLFLAAPTSAKQLGGVRRGQEGRLAVAAAAVRSRRGDDDVSIATESHDTSTMTCRITVFDTLYERQDDGGSSSIKNGSALGNEKQICCIPIYEEKSDEEEEEASYVESRHHVYPIELPSHTLEEHQGAIHEGELLLSLSGASLHNDGVLLHNTTQFTILDDDSLIARRLRVSRRRGLEGEGKDYNAAFGTRTLKVIRVSTSDSQPTYTAAEMEDRIFQQRIGLSSQYEACSFGQLQWKSNGVLDVLVDGDIGSYESGSALRVAAEEKMQQLQIISESASELADNVMFCLAPGTGDWVANAGTKYWRSQFNDQWCLSLTATMHEIAHNLGLGHSNHNGKAYADETGYMAAAWLDVDWPRKCFNGANHDKLHWFASRTLAYDPILTGPRKVQLATFVDYDKTTSFNEPVLIRLANKFVLQYNVAKGFNQDTEEMINQVTIVQKTSAGTDLLNGISSVGETFQISNFVGSGEVVVIEICERISTNDDPEEDAGDNAPEMIIVGIGVFGKSACGLKLYVIPDDEVPEEEEEPLSPAEQTPVESTEKPPAAPKEDDMDDPLPPAAPQAPPSTTATEAPGASNDNDSNQGSHHPAPWKIVREAWSLQSVLLAWEAVAKRTTWFEYFIHK